MGIGIGLHCWYCEHGPCNGECTISGQIKKSELRDKKIEKILESSKKKENKNNK